MLYDDMFESTDKNNDESSSEEQQSKKKEPKMYAVRAEHAGGAQTAAALAIGANDESVIIFNFSI